MNEQYDLAIVGGGISGAALVYEMARFTNIKSILLLEKYEDIGTLNTKGTSNSQTIHFGDIETNYTLQKANITKQTAKMVEKYCLRNNYQNKIIFSHQKMALGVGEEEVEFMLQRYEEFSTLFPYLEVWDKNKLKELEPKVVYGDQNKDRTEPIVGVGARGEWTTVDFGKMAKSLIENAKKEGLKVDVFLNSKVEKIEKDGDIFKLHSNNKIYQSNFTVVNAGAHSLNLAHKMGYGLDFGCLPIAGSFYLTKQKFLNGKVYMIQNPKLPFAALHGDPDILADGFTRFGPTALVLPKLERYKSGTYKDFYDSLRLDSNVLSVFWDLFKDSDIRNYILRNFLFEVPLINKSLFVQDAKKIVPTLKQSDIIYAKGFGGVRPQVIDKKQKRLMLGEASINPKNGIIFNMTPSPGATSCLGNAQRDLLEVVSYLGLEFNSDKFREELLEDEYCVLPDPIEIQKRNANRIRDEIYKTEKRYFSDIHDNSVPHYWDKPYNPWRNRRDHWSF